MSYVNGLNAIRAYGGSPMQEEALLARHTQDRDEQVRIAEKSSHRLVLMNLAMNRNLHEDAVSELYSRDLPHVTKRLNALGYEQSVLGQIKNALF